MKTSSMISVPAFGFRSPGITLAVDGNANPQKLPRSYGGLTGPYSARLLADMASAPATRNSVKPGLSPNSPEFLKTIELPYGSGV